MSDGYGLVDSLLEIIEVLNLYVTDYVFKFTDTKMTGWIISIRFSVITLAVSVRFGIDEPGYTCTFPAMLTFPLQFIDYCCAPLTSA
jgi:hypothetical protein